MLRYTVIPTALAVFLANAVCACGGEWGRIFSPSPAPQARCADGDCCDEADHDLDHPDADRPPCPHQDHPDHHDGHSCAHCTGAVTVENAVVTDVSVHHLVGQVPIAPLSARVSTMLDTAGDHVRKLHDGLPPPVPRTTLLSLACSLTI